MRAMKDSGIAWIGEIPKEWNTSKIKFIADFDPACDFENVSAEDKVAYAPMECIKQGFYEARDALYEELPHSLTPFQNGDIVMAKVTPCFENGNIAIMNELPSGIGLGSSELFVFRTRNIVAKYLFYWLQNSDFIQRACSTMTGVGGLKRVSPFFCKNCEIHFPPFTEQHRIADYLDRKCSQIDAIIDRQQEVIEKLKAYKLSVITEAVTKGLNPHVPMKDSGVEWIGEIPEHWKLAKLKKYCHPQTGITPSTSNAEWFDGEVQWFTPGDFNGNYHLVKSKRTLSTKALESSVAVVVPANTVMIICIGATAGKVGLADVECSFNQQITALLTNSLNPKFLMYWMIANTKFIRETALFTTLPILNNQTIGDYLLLFPANEDEEKQIVDFLDEKCNKIDSTITARENVINKLSEYKKSLIYEVVTGKKEV